MKIWIIDEYYDVDNIDDIEISYEQHLWGYDNFKIHIKGDVKCCSERTFKLTCNNIGKAFNLLK